MGCECKKVAITACSISRCCTPKQILLGLARVYEFGFENGSPVLAPSFVLFQLGNARHFACRHTQTFDLWVDQEHLRADHRHLVPPDRIAQGRCQRFQDPARLLEPLQLRPFLVQRFDQRRVERVGVGVALFFGGAVLGV
jgi:hypothetical protein